MIGFVEWIRQTSKKKVIKNDPKSNNQRSTKVGNIDFKGETDRYDQKIISNDVLYLAEP